MLRFAHEHFLAGQIVQRGDRRRTRSGDDHFVHIGPGRIREGDELLALRRDGHHRRDQVDLAVLERGIQLIARHRHHDHVHLEVPGLQVFVQIGLEQLGPLVGHPAFLSLVDEVVRAVEGHADANHATLDHLVEVARERLPHQLAYVLRQRVHRRGRRRKRRIAGGRCRRLVAGCRRRRGRRCWSGRRRSRRGLLLTRACRGGSYSNQNDNPAPHTHQFLRQCPAPH